MANHSTNLNWNSPDYFKLFDDMGGSNGISGGGGGGGAAAALNANNVPNGNNANFGSFDFYGNSLANGIGSNTNNNNNPNSNGATTVPTVSSPPSVTMINQTFQYQYQYDYGNEPHSNKSNYDSGSNFMLLMEDFSAYFYNYNGSVGSGIGTTGSTINATIGFELQTNCSIANSTCNDHLGKYTLAICTIKFSAFERMIHNGTNDFSHFRSLSDFPATIFPSPIISDSVCFFLLFSLFSLLSIPLQLYKNIITGH